MAFACMMLVLVLVCRIWGVRWFSRMARSRNVVSHRIFEGANSNKAGGQIDLRTMAAKKATARKTG